MLVALTVFQCIFAVIIMFTNCMVEHKFSVIKASIAVYGSKRNYRTWSDMAFIEGVLRFYQGMRLHENTENDIRRMVTEKIHKEKIGSFKYCLVKNLATKTGILMWAVIILELLIIYIDGMHIKGLRMIIIEGISLVLAVITGLFTLVKQIDKKEKKLISEVTEYVMNVYPKQIRMRKEKEKSKKRIWEDELEEEKTDITEKEALSEKDIINVLQNF